LLNLFSASQTDAESDPVRREQCVVGVAQLQRKIRDKTGCATGS
jgi:hypothetical protein